LEKEHKSIIRPIFRYPLFLLGLVIVVLGEVLSTHSGAGTDVELVVAAVGLLSMVLSIVPT
jgi:hypothetical protein